MKHSLFLFFLALTLAAPAIGDGTRSIGRRPSAAGGPSADNPLRETYRIRIGNRVDGAIEISVDGGQSWVTVGRVTGPATATGAGSTALDAAAPGAVAAISLDSLTLRASLAPGSATAGPRILRLLPAGTARAAADISTDLPRGQAIFGPLAPPLGSKLLLEDAAGRTRPLPGDYAPRVGDHLVIVVRASPAAPAMLVFENRAGGRVLSVGPSGDENVIGHVLQPLRGAGRYAAAAGAACGGVAACRPGTVEVATTSAGSGEPGGFLIERVPGGSGIRAFKSEQWPSTSTSTTRTPERPNASGSVLLVDRLTTSGPGFQVPMALSPLGGSLAGETRVEARLDGGPWEPLPEAAGDEPEAFTAAALSKRFAALGTPRSLAEGITHLRLVPAPSSPERLRAELAQAVLEAGTRRASFPPAHAERKPSHSSLTASRGAPRGLDTPTRGGLLSRAPRRVSTPPARRAGHTAAKAPRKATKTLRVVANIQGRGIVYVMFYVDGQIRKMTNTPPFDWLWDTRSTPNGTHSLEIRGADAEGRILTSRTQQVTVYN